MPTDSGSPAVGRVQRALGEAQRADRVAQHHHRRAVGGVEHDAARRLELGRGHRHHRLELRAQPRLLGHRTAGELVHLQEHHAGEAAACAGPMVTSAVL